jgi:enterochelin esterase-like enzyme
MGLAHHDLFHMLGMHSFPVPENHWILQEYRQAGELPISVFLHHGTHDTGTAPLLADVLREKGVPLSYIETHGGHAHGSWRTTTDDMLEYFFGSETGEN